VQESHPSVSDPTTEARLTRRESNEWKTCDNVPGEPTMSCLPHNGSHPATPVTGSTACPTPRSPFSLLHLLVWLSPSLQLQLRAFKLFSSHSHQHSPTHADRRGARMAAAEPFSIRYARTPNFSVLVRLALPPLSIWHGSCSACMAHELASHG
jgi:hypothetical protein